MATTRASELGRLGGLRYAWSWKWEASLQFVSAEHFAKPDVPIQCETIVDN